MFDYETGRCGNCDSRYCGTICHAEDPGYAYAVGYGHVPLARAWELLSTGQTVRVDWPASRVEYHARWPQYREYKMPETGAQLPVKV